MKITYVSQPTPIEVLIERHRNNNGVLSTAKLAMLGCLDNDVYNISQAFVWRGKRYIAGRIEQRDSERSAIGFFEFVGEHTYRLTQPLLPMMQDPCIEIIDGQLIVGGTEIYTDGERITSWNTSFFKGTDLDHLTKFAQAPAKMKDVRLVQTDRIHVFTRPQGGVAGPGKIGYIDCPNLADVTIELIHRAPLLETTFPKGAWGGVNQVHVLKNGLLGIVGHIAVMSEGDVRHYYGMVFCFNPSTRQATEVEIICERSDFQAGATKRPDLVDVVFLGGMVRNADGTATIYTGLSDAEAHQATISDPFLRYEAMQL
ncbi:MAG: DUF1861 family protein [Bacillus subtilis]|nr:DUF1861 family protein [Bacillus subtilis]